MTFYETVLYCLGNKELLSEFDRLRGTNLSQNGSPIELAVDYASGRMTDDMGKFIEFCWEFIYIGSRMMGGSRTRDLT